MPWLKGLVKKAWLQVGQVVLDVATGTGLAALAAARLVGYTGRVVATHLFNSMLQQVFQAARLFLCLAYACLTIACKAGMSKGRSGNAPERKS